MADIEMADIKLITFDLDNTLWAVDPVIVRAEQIMRAYLTNLVPDFDERFDRDAMWQIRQTLVDANPGVAHDLSLTRELVLTEALGRCGFSDKEAASHAAEAFDRFLDARHDVRLFQGVATLLETLSQRYTLYALTNGNADVRRLSIGQFFSGYHSSATAKASKPAPQMFHAALAQAGLDPTQSVHVGDNLVDDIHGANSVGMHSIWVNFTPEKTVEHLADSDITPSHTVHRLDDIPAAIESLAQPPN